MEKKLYDISDVCRLLGTTSRTLRFYEEKGIISSTTLGISTRRQYTEEQMSHIRNVLVLRALGLSVKAIIDLQAEKYDLREAVLSKRAEIYASIDSRLKEINLLNEALCTLEVGKSIFDKDWQDCKKDNSERMEIAKQCTNAIIENKQDILYKYLSPRLIQYMPRDVYDTVRTDTFDPLGNFVSYDGIVVDEIYPNKLYSNVRFSKLGLKITFVFHNGVIEGLWLGYYDARER